MPDGTPRAPDRLLAIFSDVEMGTGGPLDDFPHPEFLAGLIDAYGAHPGRELAIDLVFNGDTFDFLKTPVADTFPRHITAELALSKLEAIASAHRPFFAAVRGFLGGSSGERQVHFVVGNHDAELWIGFGDRKLLQAGCMRNEYMIAGSGEVLRPIPKCYVEAFLRGGQPVVSRFVELEAPPAPEGYVPASIFDVLPAVRALGLVGTHADQLAQEPREHAEGGQG